MVATKKKKLVQYEQEAVRSESYARTWVWRMWWNTRTYTSSSMSATIAREHPHLCGAVMPRTHRAVDSNYICAATAIESHRVRKFLLKDRFYSILCFIAMFYLVGRDKKSMRFEKFPEAFTQTEQRYALAINAALSFGHISVKNARMLVVHQLHARCMAN